MRGIIRADEGWTLLGCLRRIAALRFRLHVLVPFWRRFRQADEGVAGCVQPKFDSAGHPLGRLSPAPAAALRQQEHGLRTPLRSAAIADHEIWPAAGLANVA